MSAKIRAAGVVLTMAIRLIPAAAQDVPPPRSAFSKRTTISAGAAAVGTLN
jgi:hypothetical protein